MKESVVEKKLVASINNLGGDCYKLTSPNNAGLPDRLILMPNGAVYFVELKRPKGKLRPLQEYRKKRIEALGHTVKVIDTLEGVENFINELQTS